MSKTQCPRLWQAHAIEDGRLEAAAELASFERHAKSCLECARELESLAGLQRAMQQLPEPRMSDLEQQRMRAELLRRADQRLMATSHVPRTVLAAAAIVACTGIAAALLIAMPRSEEAVAASPSAAAPRFAVQREDVAALWTTQRQGTTQRVKLEDGRVTLEVAKLKAPWRFFVDLPDGRIEVRGTRFTVEVVEGQTRSVQVDEGRVALSLDGMPTRMLGAGEHFRREPALPTARADKDAAVAGATPRTARSREARRDDVPETAVPSQESDAFAQGVRAYHRGAFSEADDLLGEFQRRSPDDPRAEDAAFLRAAARHRLGDAQGAAALAEAYLARFPKGLRRAEVQRLIAR